MDAWALISVSDKAGIEPLAHHLVNGGLKLLATSSTAGYLTKAGFKVESVEELTGFGEILEGRVKTLHPRIYAGLLATGRESHQAVREKVGAPDIRVLVVNLYPFEREWQKGAQYEQLIELIDIGGVSLIRAAAKNYERVSVLVSPEQYPKFMQQPWDVIEFEERRRLAHQAFQHVAYYDAIIAEALEDGKAEWPELFVLAGRRQDTLRYGENPHQSGAFYAFPRESGLARERLIQGKALSYNNLADTDTAFSLAYDFDQPACVIVKHQTPCAAALGQSVEEAYAKAHDADPVSIFGGIVALNRPIDEDLAQRLTQVFLEVIVAPEVTLKARKILSVKKNVRVLVLEPGPITRRDIKGIEGGFLVQSKDKFSREVIQWQHVAGPRISDELYPDVMLAWKTVGRVKSNALVVVKDGVTVGVGGGQTNRIDAARQALQHAGQKAHGAILASDGFFPFDDVLRLAQECGIGVVVEPGGSLRDQDSIQVAEQAGITLLMTGERHFRH